MNQCGLQYTSTWKQHTSAKNLCIASYLYLKLAKCYGFLILSYVFSSIKSENKRKLEGDSGGEVAQTMYTHVNKCKNGKTKERKINKNYVQFYLSSRRSFVLQCHFSYFSS
jgi:hypothetical protein